MFADFHYVLIHIDRHPEALVGQYGVWITVILFPVIFVETGPWSPRFSRATPFSSSPVPWPRRDIYRW